MGSLGKHLVLEGTSQTMENNADVPTADHHLHLVWESLVFFWLRIIKERTHYVKFSFHVSTTSTKVFKFK